MSQGEPGGKSLRPCTSSAQMHVGCGLPKLQLCRAIVVLLAGLGITGFSIGTLEPPTAILALVRPLLQDFQTRHRHPPRTHDLSSYVMIRNLLGVGLTWCFRIRTDGVE